MGEAFTPGLLLMGEAFTPGLHLHGLDARGSSVSLETRLGNSPNYCIHSLTLAAGSATFNSPNNYIHLLTFTAGSGMSRASVQAVELRVKFDHFWSR